MLRQDCRHAVLCPLFHHEPSFFNQSAPPVSRFGFISDSVCEGHLCYVARELCLLAGPVAKARPEAVDGEGQAETLWRWLLEQVVHRALGERERRSGAGVAVEDGSSPQAPVARHAPGRPSFVTPAPSIASLPDQNSAHVDPVTSSVLAAVRMVNRRARRDFAWRSGSLAMKAGTWANGMAAWCRFGLTLLGVGGRSPSDRASALGCPQRAAREPSPSPARARCGLARP